MRVSLAACTIRFGRRQKGRSTAAHQGLSQIEMSSDESSAACLAEAPLGAAPASLTGWLLLAQNPCSGRCHSNSISKARPASIVILDRLVNSISSTLLRRSTFSRIRAIYALSSAHIPRVLSCPLSPTGLSSSESLPQSPSSVAQHWHPGHAINDPSFLGL